MKGIGPSSIMLNPEKYSERNCSTAPVFSGSSKTSFIQGRCFTKMKSTMDNMNRLFQKKYLTKSKRSSKKTPPLEAHPKTQNTLDFYHSCSIVILAVKECATLMQERRPVTTNITSAKQQQNADTSTAQPE